MESENYKINIRIYQECEGGIELYIMLLAIENLFAALRSLLYFINYFLVLYYTGSL